MTTTECKLTLWPVNKNALKEFAKALNDIICDAGLPSITLVYAPRRNGSRIGDLVVYVSDLHASL